MTYVLIHKGGIGDALLTGTIALELLYKKIGGKVYLHTLYPELFAGTKLRHLEKIGLWCFRRYAKLFPKKLKCIDMYTSGWYRDNPTSSMHILEVQAAKLGLKLDQIEPKIAFEVSDKVSIEKEHGKIYIGIQSVGKGKQKNTKNYFFESYQKVVVLLKTRSSAIEFVQLGTEADPLLEGVKWDLKGKTSIRGVFHVMRDLDFFIGQAGFLMHAAKVQKTPAAIIYGGRGRSFQDGYPENINFESQIDCSPCWSDNCLIDQACMREIDPELIVQKVLESLQERGFLSNSIN